MSYFVSGLDTSAPIIPSTLSSSTSTGKKILIASGYTPIMIPNEFLLGDFFVSFSKFKMGKVEENYTFSLCESLPNNLSEADRNAIKAENTKNILDLKSKMKQVDKVSSCPDSNEALNIQKSIEKVPKKSPNAFILYRRDWHKKLIKNNPKTQARLISSQIAEQWKKESYSVKAEYIELAKKKRKQFIQSKRNLSNDIFQDNKALDTEPNDTNPSYVLYTAQNDAVRNISDPKNIEVGPFGIIGQQNDSMRLSDLLLQRGP
ncbi:hypothetical protein BB560_001343 [Smittium megazygosporum]|uniref:HMG box domain-containing protein n=1 Tax=Smittium megazygosporum TaxID=133381 RepID=A0A2T9ZHT0_9FUNG|nr:hypothetical protein BB560_001343 [Smittium megazygosporum]